MLLVTHIVIALSSIGFTSYLFISPAQNRFKYAYALIGSTLVSGVILVASAHSNLLSACTTGIAYLSVVSLGIAAAHKRLATSRANNSSNKLDY